MKKSIFGIIVLWGLICCPQLYHAQDLSFSQVLNITSVEDTVPAGKVWKLTAMTTTATGVVNIGGGPVGYAITVNGNSEYVGHSAMAENDMAMSAATISIPFWFPAGTRLRTGSNISMLSIVEFSVGP